MAAYKIKNINAPPSH